EDEDEDERDDRRRARGRQGLSGLAIGLIAGGVALALLLVIGLGVFFIARASAGPGVVADYNFDIGPNQFHARNQMLRSGNTYEFRVDSNQNTDVDLHVFDPGGQQVGFDETIGPNSLITLKAAMSGQYRIEVANLDPARGNHSHVVIRNLGTGEFAVKPIQNA